MHSKNKGYITVATKNKGLFKPWHYKYKDIPAVVGQKNVFMSMNTFSCTYRRIEYLDELNALYVDIDFYRTKFKLKDVLRFYETLVAERKLPRATVVIRSGRGLYLEWKLKKESADKIANWQEIENHFASLLLDVGADMNATDVCRVLRPPGTLYSKDKKKATVDLLDFQANLVYSLESLAEYLPAEIEKEIEAPPSTAKPQKERKKRKPSKTAKLLNTYNLNYTRIRDLIQLCELRNWDMYHYHQRELTLFLYRYWSLCYYRDPELALEKTLELNSQFIVPLSEREATNATKSTERAFEKWESEEMVLWNGKMRRKGYNYTNESLIQLLRITDEEQKHMQTIISVDEKYRRNNERRTPRNENGLTTREQAKRDRIEAITTMLQQGLKQSQIAQELGISRQAVSKLIKNI